MIVVFLYNMSRIYFDKHKAKAIAISFGLFTYLFTFSAVFTRDIHVALIYTAGFYILLSRATTANFIALLILCSIAWTFRAVNGVFFLTFIFFYLLLYRSKNRRSFLFLCIILSFMTLVALFFASEIE